MRKHNFVLAAPSGGDKYHCVIYCTWCGLAVWYFNREPEWNFKELQSKVGKSCVGFDVVEAQATDAKD